MWLSTFLRLANLSLSSASSQSKLLFRSRSSQTQIWLTCTTWRSSLSTPSISPWEPIGLVKRWAIRHLSDSADKSSNKAYSPHSTPSKRYPRATLANIMVKALDCELMQESKMKHRLGCKVTRTLDQSWNKTPRTLRNCPLRFPLSPTFSRCNTIRTRWCNRSDRPCQQSPINKNNKSNSRIRCCTRPLRSCSVCSLLSLLSLRSLFNLLRMLWCNNSHSKWTIWWWVVAA